MIDRTFSENYLRHDFTSNAEYSQRPTAMSDGRLVGMVGTTTPQPPFCKCPTEFLRDILNRLYLELFLQI